MTRSSKATRGDVVEFFVRREDADRLLGECVKDEPEWAGVLSVVEVELEGPFATLRSWT